LLSKITKGNPTVQVRQSVQENSYIFKILCVQRNHFSIMKETLLKKESTSSRYKTELCRPFTEYKHCKYGEKCQFAHGQNELRSTSRHPKYKTELCKTYHTLGLCPYGHRCHFVHEDSFFDQSGLPMPENASSGSISSPSPTSSINDDIYDFNQLNSGRLPVFSQFNNQAM